MELLSGCSDDDDIDPMYKVFLDHLREDETSYVLDMVDEDDGSSILIKYEKEDELPETRAGANFGSSCTSGQASEHGNGVANPKPIQNASCVPENQLENIVDHNYLKFLNHIKLQNRCMILEWKPDVVVRYEGNEASAHSVGLSSYRTPSSGGKRSMPYESSSQHSESQSESEEDNGCMLTGENDVSQQYEKKLVNVLSKPYDQSEYEELLKLATEHKPRTKLRHLRSDSVTYVTKKKGMAYLDHHPDLSAQIKNADSRTALKLLRGFFFWLKEHIHLGHRITQGLRSHCHWISETLMCNMTFLPSVAMKILALVCSLHDDG